MNLPSILLLLATAVLIVGVLSYRRNYKKGKALTLSAEEVQDTIHTDSTPGI